MAPEVWDNYDLVPEAVFLVPPFPPAGPDPGGQLRPPPGSRPVALRSLSKTLPSIRPALPDREEQRALIQRDSYRNSRPEEWENIGAEDREAQQKWLKVMGLQGLTFEELFISHCANHANFIEPAYQVLEDHQPVPYSLGKTRTVCSACLEFYNIIGASFQKKYVVPCPGAVLFAGMVPNHYYEVISP